MQNSLLGEEESSKLILNFARINVKPNCLPRCKVEQHWASWGTEVPGSSSVLQLKPNKTGTAGQSHWQGPADGYR